MQNYERANALVERVRQVLLEDDYSDADVGYALAMLMAEFLYMTAKDPVHFLQGVGILNEKFFSVFKQYCDEQENASMH